MREKLIFRIIDERNGQQFHVSFILSRAPLPHFYRHSLFTLSVIDFESDLIQNHRRAIGK